MTTDDTPPARLQTRATWLISQTGRHAHRLMTDALAKADARGYDYRVLAALQEFGPLSQATLGRHTDMDRSDVAQTVDDLAHTGLVGRSTDPVDRRRNIITITPAGIRRLRRLDQLMAEVQDKLLAPLAHRDRQTLMRMLTRVLDHHSAAG
jgi:MarR family transcriptional regulator, lower aerobic nicotinate degradation pathway regulator